MAILVVLGGPKWGFLGAQKVGRGGVFSAPGGPKWGFPARAGIPHRWWGSLNKYIFRWDFAHFWRKKQASLQAPFLEKRPFWAPGPEIPDFGIFEFRTFFEKNKAFRENDQICDLL